MRGVKTANIRAFVIVVIAIVITVVYVAHLDVGNLSALGIGVIAAICPLGVLETSLADMTLLPRALYVLFAALLLVVVFGRAFCAWVCPVPLLQRWFPGWRRHKKDLGALADGANDGVASATDGVVASAANDTATSATDGVAASTTASKDEAVSLAAQPQTDALCGKHKNLKLDSRHIVLGGSLLSAAIFGFPVFCLVCPVGLTFASLLVVYRLFGFGELTWTIVIFPLILILELLLFRKWCSKLCPLGALLSLAAGLNRLFRPRINENACLVTKGVNCTACAQACNRENIDIRRPKTSKGALSDCTKCRDCADACPVKAIDFPLLEKHKEG